MSLLDHQELSIVKGVGPTPGDTTSAEQPLTVVDLLTSGSAFALADWTPNIPSLKSGGTWADSPISDGRTLIAGVNTNVTETIVVLLTGTTIANFASQFAKFQRMIQDARDFWDTFYQIEPVYIRWWANQAPGPQFALIYNIDMDVDWDEGNSAQAKLTLTIEREFGWRGVRPGGNPKEWTYYSRKQIFSPTVSDLNSGTDHLVNATIQNRREWNVAQTSLLSQNYFDVPATSVPGDLNALCCLSATLGSVGAVGARSIYYANTSKPDLLVAGVAKKPAYILNGGDGSSFGTDTTTAADTGAPISTGAGTNQRGVVSFATVATDVMRFSWNSGARALFDFSSMRGRFVAFLRCRLSAASTVTMHLHAIAGSNAAMDFPTQTLTSVGSGGVGNTTAWQFVYMGVVAFPFTSERVIVTDAGTGILTTTGSIELYAARTGAAVSLYVSDLLFLPIDESAGVINTGQLSSSGEIILIDNTGYFLHGDTNDEAHIGGTSLSLEQAGQSLSLKPNVNNRIIMFESNTTPQSEIPPTFTARLNIVPRWSGIRDK